jgi:hypothetical protein
MVISSVEDTRCLRSCYAAENTANCHTNTAKITLPQNIAGHNFPGGEQIGRWFAILHQHLRPVIYRNPHIGKGNAGT